MNLTPSELSLSFTLNNIIAFAVVYIFDVIIHHFKSPSPWFHLHSIINFIIIIYSFNDVMLCFHDPNKSLMPISNYYGGSFSLSLHLYHSIFYKLTPMDVFHHVLFVFLLTPLAINYQNKGLSLVYFFCTGLPGCVDYFLLSLVKNNNINYLFEKKINSYLNTYLRMPGGFIASYLIFKDGLLMGNMNIYTNTFLSCIIFYNVGYFGKLSIENHVERFLKDKDIPNT